jgi:predicted transcriptional regulator
LPTNFHKHQKTHGMTIKEYKLWLTQLLLDRDRAQSAGGGGGAGFGGARDDIGDDFGGGFGGGFGDEDDRGAQDDRFVDVPDEPAEAKVTLAVALKDKGTRNKLREVDDLWLSNVRARIAPSEKTKTTYFGQAVSLLELLSAPGRELVARVTLLEPNSTAAHVKRFARQVAETLEDLVPIGEWAKKVDKKRAGSTAVGLIMLERLFAWAKVQHETSLAAELGVGAEPPRSLVLARVTAASLQTVAAQARAASHKGVLAKRATALAPTNSWQKMSDALIGLAAYKEKCESELEKLLTGDGLDKEKLQELSTEELRALALVCLVGGGDFPALRINVDNSLAADSGKANDNDHKMTILRQRDGRILLQVVDKQKGHIMSPIDISERARTTAKVLNAN